MSSFFQLKYQILLPCILVKIVIYVNGMILIFQFSYLEQFLRICIM